MRRARQGGQAAVEYLYVLPILLLLLFGALQFSFIYEAKLTLNQAVFAATRRGAVNSGAMEAIQDGLEAGLAPLFTRDSTQAELKAGRLRAHDLIGNPQLALITIVNPTPSALSEFTQSLNWTADGGDGIPNDNLMYRSTTAGSSGMNIQDANLLKVRVTFCYRMIVPILNKMIYTFTTGVPTTPKMIDSTYAGGPLSANEMLAVATPSLATGLCGDPDKNGYTIPVTSEAVVRMQSPFKDPGAWTAP